MECFKCLGSGHFRMYSHIEGGKCFQCNGTGRSDAVRVSLKSAKAMPEVRTQAELRALILTGEMTGLTFKELHECRTFASNSEGAGEREVWREWVRRGGERAYNAA